MIFGAAIWFIQPEIPVLGFEGSSSFNFVFQADAGLHAPGAVAVPGRAV